MCIPGIDFSKNEDYNSRSCADKFNTIRKELISRKDMENARWTQHTYLNANSRIVEVGGFVGVDAAKFILLANPYYLVLEPVPEYYKILEKKFSTNPKVTLFKFGLGKINKTIKIGVVSGDATSLFEKNETSKRGQNQTLIIRDATEFFTSLDVQRKPVDLLMINCEGCEYELLEVLIASSLIQYFKHVQFQFHLDLPGIAHQECRYCQIMSLLRRTHKPMFQFSYTWQAWQLK